MADTMTTLVFAIAGDRRVAFRSEEVAAVLALPRLLRPAGTPEPILGFANVGGRSVAVLGLATLLEGTPAPLPALSAHLLLLKPVAGTAVALLLDRVTDVRAISSSALRPVPAAESANGCVLALTDDGDAAALIAGDRLLLAAERRRVRELTAALDARERSVAPA